MILASANSLDVTAILIALLGGLSLFLYGMEKMTEALKNIAGDKLKTVLAKFTSNRFSAVFTGAFVTAIIQSSSVTTVLVVGFISAGMMTLMQSVGVIMGANIGTTITAQIIAFKVTKYAMVLIAVGFITNFAAKKEQLKWLGAMLFGLGLIFFGMDLMSQATSPLRTHEPFIELMKSMTNPIYGVAVGALFTALVQSSSATTGIVIVLASQGFITLESGIALTLGANIGTCTTAMLSTIGKPREALQTALVHVIFNVLGALVWVFLIGFLADWVRSISPVAAHLSGTEKIAAEVPRQIANAHTLFNIANTILFIGFTVPLARFAQRIAPSKPPKNHDKVKALYLNKDFLDTPSLAINQLRMEVGHLGKLAGQVIQKAFLDTSKKNSVTIEEKSHESELLHEQIIEYSRDIVKNSKTSKDAETVSNWISIAQYLKSISETIVLNNKIIYEHEFLHKEQFTDDIDKIFEDMCQHLYKNLNNLIAAIENDDSKKAHNILRKKNEFTRLLDELLILLRKNLVTPDKIDLELYQNELEVIEILKRINYFLRRTAKTFPDHDAA